MAGRSLTGRVDALEEMVDPKFKGGVFIVQAGDETPEEARQRWEAKNGPLDGRMAIVWVSTGVPRKGGMYEAQA